MRPSIHASAKQNSFDDFLPPFQGSKETGVPAEASSIPIGSNAGGVFSFSRNCFDTGEVRRTKGREAKYRTVEGGTNLSTTHRQGVQTGKGWRYDRKWQPRPSGEIKIIAQGFTADRKPPEQASNEWSRRGRSVGPQTDSLTESVKTGPMEWHFSQFMGEVSFPAVVLPVR